MSDNEVIESLGVCELLCQVAEEASELAQAALKLRRAIDGSNPTPKKDIECLDDMIEEVADLSLCLNRFWSAAELDQKILWETQDKIIDEKRFRWAYRIREARGNE